MPKQTQYKPKQSQFQTGRAEISVTYSNWSILLLLSLSQDKTRVNRVNPVRKEGKIHFIFCLTQPKFMPITHFEFANTVRNSLSNNIAKKAKISNGAKAVLIF